MTCGRLNQGGILRRFYYATGRDVILCSWGMCLKLQSIIVCCTVAKPFVGISLQIRYVTISCYKSCGRTLCWDLQGAGCKLLLLCFSGFLVCLFEPPMSGVCFASHGAVACDVGFLGLVDSTLLFSCNVLMVRVVLNIVMKFMHTS